MKCMYCGKETNRRTGILGHVVCAECGKKWNCWKLEEKNILKKRVSEMDEDMIAIFVGFALLPLVLFHLIKDKISKGEESSVK